MSQLTHYTQFLAYVRKLAHDKRETAGYNGEWHDGGAQALEDVADAFESGLKGGMPKPLVKYYVEFTKATDPEYQKYLELKSKFA